MENTGQHTEPDGRTRATEDEEAARAHRADRPASPEEERAADRHLAESDERERRDVAGHYEEMSEIGAEAEGEGRID
jgi:hypothetical protein